MSVLGRHKLTVAAVEANLVVELHQVNDRDINLLSGGELQRFAIGIVCVQQADVYDNNSPEHFPWADVLLATCSMSPPHISM